MRFWKILCEFVYDLLNTQIMLVGAGEAGKTTFVEAAKAVITGDTGWKRKEQSMRDVGERVTRPGEFVFYDIGGRVKYLWNEKFRKHKPKYVFYFVDAEKFHKNESIFNKNLKVHVDQEYRVRADLDWWCETFEKTKSKTKLCIACTHEDCIGQEGNEILESLKSLTADVLKKYFFQNKSNVSFVMGSLNDYESAKMFFQKIMASMEN